MIYGGTMTAYSKGGTMGNDKKLRDLKQRIKENIELKNNNKRGNEYEYE